MAREIVVWCDPCMEQDERTDGREITITLTGKPKTIAMCGRHEDELVKPLAHLLDEFGVNPEGVNGRQGPRPLVPGQARHGKPPSGGRPNQCLWCELSYSADGGGFGRHLKVVHGFNGFKEAFGGTCPICGDGEFELMLAHVQRSHPEMGFKAVAEPFIWARDNGDPHGVYAYKLTQEGSLDPEQEWEKTRQAESAGLAARTK